MAESAGRPARYPVAVMPNHVVDVVRDRELDPADSSSESFDRVAFAWRAVALVKPPNMRVAIAEGGGARVVVEKGRAWGRAEDARWAMLCVPPTASRRAIALAVATLSAQPPAPYVLDALFAGSDARDA
jgi:hypothetical protein